MRLLRLLRRLAMTGILVCAFSSAAELPPEALAILNEFPDKKLTLEIVTRRAASASDSFKSLRAWLIAAEAPLNQSLAMTDPRFVAKGQYQDDRREPQNPFMPTQIKGSFFSVGVSSYLNTGTTLGFDLSQGFSTLNFALVPSSTYSEARGLLSVTQNLWKNSFGAGSRAERLAAEQSVTANRYSYTQSREDWFIQLSQLYYSAWLSQAQFQASVDNLGRRKRLLNTIELKSRRGTAEQPDLLQVQSACANSEVQLASAQQDLSNQWWWLVTTLKLPKALETIDPSLVPISLGEISEQASKACAASAPSSTTSMEYARAIHGASVALLDKAQWENKPGLDLAFGVGTNGVAPGPGDSWSDVFKISHPYLSAGISFSIPLGFHGEKARVATAEADVIRAEAKLEQAKDSVRVEWQNGCRDLERLLQSRTTLEKAFKLQSKRVQLEEDRFGLGRSTTFQVIQSGDDMTQTELLLRSFELQVQVAAWKILRLSGEMNGYLEGLLSSK